MSVERRVQSGVAIVTSRPRVIDEACRQAHLSARTLAVQDGPSWPIHRPPLLLDTVGLSVDVLLALLAAPPRTQPTDTPITLGALADPADWRTLRLLKLCPAVRLIGGSDLAAVRTWLADLLPTSASMQIAAPLWLLTPPPALDLDPLLLRALAALRISPSYAAAAARCGLSERTLLRLIGQTRVTLGLPHSAAARYRPEVIAELILAHLGDAPAPQSEVVDS